MLKLREFSASAALDCISICEVFLDKDKRKGSKARGIGPGFNEAEKNAGGEGH